MQAQQFSNCKQRLIVGCELQFSQSGICELLVNNLAVSRNSCQSVLHQSVLSFYIISNLQLKKSKINKVIDVFQSRYTSNSNHKIYYDLNGDELEKICKHLYKYRLITEAGNGLQVMKWLFYRLCKIPRKTTAVESYFSALTGLAILLKQKSTTNDSVKTFTTDLFYVTTLNGCFWIWRQFL